MFQIHVTVRLHTKKETKCSVIKVITIKTNTSYNLSKIYIKATYTLEIQCQKGNMEINYFLRMSSAKQDN